MQNLFIIFTNIQGGVRWKNFSEPLNNNLEKYLRKNSIFGSNADSENEINHTYFSRILLKAVKGLVSFVQDFSQGSISKPKLLLAANMLIYLDITVDISIMHFVNDLLIYFVVVVFPLFWCLKRLN